MPYGNICKHSHYIYTQISCMYVYLIIIIQQMFQYGTNIIFWKMYVTHRELYQFMCSLLNQTQIRMYIPLSDWFGTKQTVSVWFQINRIMVNRIWFVFDLIRFWIDIAVYICLPSADYIFWIIIELGERQEEVLIVTFRCWLLINT